MYTKSCAGSFWPLFWPLFWINILRGTVRLLDWRRGTSYNAFVRPLISPLLGGLRRPLRYQFPSLVPKEQCTHHRSALARHWVGLPRHHCCPLEAHVWGEGALCDFGRASSSQKSIGICTSRYKIQAPVLSNLVNHFWKTINNRKCTITQFSGTDTIV